MKELTPSPVMVCPDSASPGGLSADPKFLLQRPPPFCWEDFYDQYKGEVDELSKKVAGFKFATPIPLQLYFRAQKVPNTSPTGPDRRSPGELKALPLWVWDMIAKVLDAIFLHGAPWPSCPRKAHVVVIPRWAPKPLESQTDHGLVGCVSHLVLSYVSEPAQVA